MKADKIQRVRRSKQLVAIAFGICAVFAFFALNGHLRANQIAAMSDEQFDARAQHFNLFLSSEAQLRAIVSRSLDISPENLELAQKANDRLLSKRPDCGDCRLWAAIIDHKTHGVLSETGRAHLSASFDASPYGNYDVMTARLSLAEKNWSSLDVETRKAAERQITGLAETQAGREWLSRFATGVPALQSRLDRVR